jgi:thioredoxin-related protein
MKRSFKAIMLTAVVAIASAFAAGEITELSIGAAIPKGDMKMPDVVSGKDISLGESKGKNGLLVIFSCNTCPYVKLSEKRLIEVAELAKRNGIGVVVVNSNEAYRDADDSFDAMKKYAEEQKYTFAYVVDKNSELANAFGATRTPHVFLFDNKGLAYKGAIDDNIKDITAVKENYLKDAITAVGAGKEVKTNSTKSIGCTIKRKES